MIRDYDAGIRHLVDCGWEFPEGVRTETGGG